MNIRNLRPWKVLLYWPQNSEETFIN